MMLPNIDALRCNRWEQNEFVLHRLGALQEMENQLAAVEGRKANKIGVIPPNERVVYDGQALLRGQYNPEKELIQVDPLLLEDPHPFAAVETLFHEARHSQQQQLIDAYPPGDGPPEVEDFRRNWEPGVYARGKVNQAQYLHQPIERDARAVAGERVEQLYGRQFADRKNFPAYRDQMKARFLRDEAIGRAAYGEHFVEEARHRMIVAHEQMQAQEQASRRAAADEDIRRGRAPERATDNAPDALKQAVATRGYQADTEAAEKDRDAWIDRKHLERKHEVQPAVESELHRPDQAKPQAAAQAAGQVLSGAGAGQDAAVLTRGQDAAAQTSGQNSAAPASGPDPDAQAAVQSAGAAGSEAAEQSTQSRRQSSPGHSEGLVEPIAQGQGDGGVVGRTAGVAGLKAADPGEGIRVEEGEALSQTGMEGRQAALSVPTSQLTDSIAGQGEDQTEDAAEDEGYRYGYGL